MKIKIGLETHCQLNTCSKAFCSCKNPVNYKVQVVQRRITKGSKIMNRHQSTLIHQEDLLPNTITCPTCLGFPGSKPVINKALIDYAVKIALFLNCKINTKFFFSRKTYFYPDMSKNFQITQYEVPLAKTGFMKIGKKKINIRRLHIEEDPAKLVHSGDYVLVDYNRSGIPLIEIVTEPDFETPEEAKIFLQKLETILEYIGVYDSTSCAVMKSDVNISVGGGARIEVKNITGTKEVEEALNYEISRQSELLRKGKKPEPGTRRWNPEKKITEPMREKETEEDYGYIFEPDLPKIELNQAYISKLKKELPETPEQKSARFMKQYKLPKKIIEVLVSELALANLFEEIKDIDVNLAASWIAGPLKKTLNWNNLKFKETKIKSIWIADVLKMFKAGKLSDRNAELTIRKMVDERKSPKEIIKKYNLEIAALDIEKIVKTILNKNKQAVADYKKGQKKVLHFLIGQAIKETKGRVRVEDLKKVILKLIK